MELNEKEFFMRALLDWYEQEGRYFPWRETKDPYKVFIAEFMLQRTQARQVLPVYLEFTKVYPNIHSLARSRREKLISILKKLGLISRAETLRDAARQIVLEFDGYIPDTAENLMKVKGVGRYTANAILCFAFNRRVPIVDSNVVRLYKRYWNFNSNVKRPHTDEKIWEMAGELLPEEDFRDFNYALIDFASIICSKHSNWQRCPIRDKCKYHVEVNPGDDEPSNNQNKHLYNI